MENLAAFVSYILIATFTPGPNNIMSMSLACRRGFKKSIPFNLGVGIGLFCIMELCIAFSAVAYAVIPSIKGAMTIVGAAYILWLAWKTLSSRPQVQSGQHSRTHSLLMGIVLQFINPKALLFGITTASTFLVPHVESALTLSFISAALGALAFVATCSWALFGAVFQKAFLTYGRLINTVMALLLVYCAASLFF